MAANKTDANDADGLAHIAEVGFFREVRVRGYDKHAHPDVCGGANTVGDDLHGTFQIRSEVS